MMAYRMGYPGWKLVSRLGFPVDIRVHVFRDEESNSFWAQSPDLDGLVVSGKTLEALAEEVTSAAHTLLELQVGEHHAKARAQMEYTVPLPCTA